MEMVNKPTLDGFTNVYASTIQEPDKTEIAIVQANLETICSGSPQFIIDNHGGAVECGCTTDDDEGPTGEYHIWTTIIPDEYAAYVDPVEERELSVVQCSICGKWAIAD